MKIPPLKTVITLTLFRWERAGVRGSNSQGMFCDPLILAFSLGEKGLTTGASLRQGDALPSALHPAEAAKRSRVATEGASVQV